MTDILFRLAVITVAAVMLGCSLPRIYFALKAEKGQVRSSGTDGPVNEHRLVDREHD